MSVVRSLTKAGYNIVTLAQADVQEDPRLMTPDSLQILTGHNEYWTLEMLNTYRNFFEAGGKTLNLSGNLMWWRIKYDGTGLYLDQNGHTRTDECLAAMPDYISGTGYPAFSGDFDIMEYLGVSYIYAAYPLSYGKGVSPDTMVNVYKADADLWDFNDDQGLILTQPDHPLFTDIAIDRKTETGKPVIFDTVPALMVEIDGIAITPENTIDRALIPDVKADPKVLATTDAFVASLVSIPGTNDRWGGPQHVGFIVEMLDDEGRAQAVSFPSIGFPLLIHAGDPNAERFLMNSMAYLLDE